MTYQGQNRRKFPRAEFPCKVSIGSPIRLINSYTENIGEGGIRVVLGEKISVFTNIGMEIFLEKERPIKCKGRVVWIVEKVNPIEQQPIMFDTGIEFIDISDADKEYIKKIVNTLVSQEKNKSLT